MVEMLVVIYDKNYTDDQWFKAELDYPQFEYLLEHCEGIGDVHKVLLTWGRWEPCEEPQSLQGSANK